MKNIRHIASIVSQWEHFIAGTMTGRNYPVTLPCVTIWFLRYEDKCSVSKDQCGFRMWSYVDISRNKASRQNIDCVGGNQRFEHVYYQVLKPRLLNKTGFYRIRKQKKILWLNLMERKCDLFSSNLCFEVNRIFFHVYFVSAVHLFRSICFFD